MFVKTYEIQSSSAINGIKVDETSVFVTYTSNIDKEYEFKCENTQEFNENLSNTLLHHALHPVIQIIICQLRI